MTVTFDPTRQPAIVRFQNWAHQRIGAPEKGWSNLDEDSLLRKAMRRTKCDDFGSDDFREPLRVLLDAACEPGMLTYTGRCLMHIMVVNLLGTRLLTEQAITRHPEILRQPIKRPLVVVGAPRTGTTLLNNLLALDPVSRPLLGWEAFRPAPRRPRFLMARSSIAKWITQRTLADLLQVHSFAYDQPDECHWLYFPSFICPPSMAFPSVKAWLDRQPESIYDNAYRDYRRALQMLEWERPAAGHWVLKSPLHLWAMESYINAIPEASLIQTHRRLDEALPSFCSLAGMIMCIFSDRVDAASMGDAAVMFAQRFIDRFTAARRRIDPARVMDLRYQDLVADPIGTVRRIYDRFGYDYTPEMERRLRLHQADPGRAASTKHDYTLGQFGLNQDQVLQQFEEYHREFGLI